jgi:hypothetical protein
MIAVSGRYIYMEPTSNRKKAWLNGFKTVQANRRLVGNMNNNPNSSGYDFRVGLAPNYSSDAGWLMDGVKFNAWVDNDLSPLLLAGHASHGLMNVWNDQMTSQELPHNPEDGFGTWIGKDAAATTSQLDFVMSEDPFYVQGLASPNFEYSPFAASFSNVFDSFTGVSGEIADTYVSHLQGPLHVMCGLIGVHIDTTVVDDSSAQTQDWTLEITVDVESWSPITKARRKKAKGRRRRSRK